MMQTSNNNPNSPTPDPWPRGWVLLGMALGAAVPLAIWAIARLS